MNSGQVAVADTRHTPVRRQDDGTIVEEHPDGHRVIKPDDPDYEEFQRRLDQTTSAGVVPSGRAMAGN